MVLWSLMDKCSIIRKSSVIEKCMMCYIFYLTTRLARRRITVTRSDYTRHLVKLYLLERSNTLSRFYLHQINHFTLTLYWLNYWHTS